MVSWQIKGLLLLAAALVATALAASTSGAGSRASLDPPAVRLLPLIATATHQPAVETIVTQPSPNWYEG